MYFLYLYLQENDNNNKKQYNFLHETIDCIDYNDQVFWGGKIMINPFPNDKF